MNERVRVPGDIIDRLNLDTLLGRLNQAMIARETAKLRFQNATTDEEISHTAQAAADWEMEGAERYQTLVKLAIPYLATIANPDLPAPTETDVASPVKVDPVTVNSI